MIFAASVCGCTGGSIFWRKLTTVRLWLRICKYYNLSRTIITSAFLNIAHLETTNFTRTERQIPVSGRVWMGCERARTRRPGICIISWRFCGGRSKDVRTGSRGYMWGYPVNNYIYKWMDVYMSDWPHGYQEPFPNHVGVQSAYLSMPAAIYPYTDTPTHSYPRIKDDKCGATHGSNRNNARKVVREQSRRYEGRGAGSGPNKGLRTQLSVIVIAFSSHIELRIASEGTQLITLADIWTFTMSCSRSNLLLHHKRCVRIGDGRIGQESVHVHHFERTPI